MRRLRFLREGFGASVMGLSCNSGLWDSKALLPAILSFKGIHANSAQAFNKQPPSKCGQRLNQHESGVKRTENSIYGFWFMVESGFKAGSRFR